MSLFCSSKTRTRKRSIYRSTAMFLFLTTFPLLPASWAAPKTVVISLDGATPRIVNDLLHRGVLPLRRGIGVLRRDGFSAKRNVVIAPSLTAASHVAIATGSTAARNDVVSNTFHLVASPFSSNISGFAAPIGGYSIDGGRESPDSALPDSESDRERQR